MGQLAIVDRAQPPAAPTFDLSDLEKIATTIARGGMFGSSDPYAVLTLCMLAQAEGQHPAVVFRDYDIIQGKPSKKAKAMLSDFLTAGGKVVWHRLDDECAEATFSHPMGGEATINWTMARAQKAGLGSKDMWKKYPRQMLRSRVVSEGVSTVFPGATSGLYVPEEVMDFDDRQPTPPTPQPTRARDLKRVEAQPSEADGTRQKAEAWVAQYEADCANATTIDGLNAIHKKAEKAIAKLAKDHPDLHERALRTYPSQPAATDGSGEATTPEAGDAAAPDLAEGRGDEDMGEHDPFRVAADRLIADARTRVIVSDLELTGKDKDDFDALPDEMQVEVGAVIQEQRRKLGAK